ncbi:MAG: hypothetical protein Q9159_004176 [Coniocarpon cinnabarinum]
MPATDPRHPGPLRAPIPKSVGTIMRAGQTMPPSSSSGSRATSPSPLCARRDIRDSGRDGVHVSRGLCPRARDPLVSISLIYEMEPPEREAHLVQPSEAPSARYSGQHVAGQLVANKIASETDPRLTAAAQGPIIEMVHFSDGIDGDVYVQYWTSVLLAVYGAALLAASPFCGWIADHTSGRRSSLIFGLVVLAAATALLAIGTSVTLLIIGRVLQGLSGAIVWICGLALLVDTVGPGNVGQAMGYVGTNLSLALFLAPLLGGVVNDAGGYEAVFGMCWGCIGLDIVLRLVMIEKKVAVKWLGVEETYGTPKPDITAGEENPHQDIEQAPSARSEDPEKRASTMTSDSEPSPPAETCSYPGSTREAATPTPIGSINALLAADVQKEDRPKRLSSPRPSVTSTLRPRSLAARIPMLTLLSSPRMIAALYATLIQASLLTAFDTTLPLRVRGLFNWTSLGAGLIFVPMTVPSFFAPLIGWWIDRHGPRWCATLAFTLAGPFIIILRLIDTNTLPQKVGLCAILTGVGTSLALTIPPSMAEIGNVVVEIEAQRPGVFGKKGAMAQAYSLFNLCFAGGCLVGPVLGGLLNEKKGWSAMTLALGVVALCTQLWNAARGLTEPHPHPDGLHSHPVNPTEQLPAYSATNPHFNVVAPFSSGRDRDLEAETARFDRSKRGPTVTAAATATTATSSGGQNGEGDGGNRARSRSRTGPAREPSSTRGTSRRGFSLRRAQGEDVDLESEKRRFERSRSQARSAAPSTPRTSGRFDRAEPQGDNSHAQSAAPPTPRMSAHFIHAQPEGDNSHARSTAPPTPRTSRQPSHAEQGEENLSAPNRRSTRKLTRHHSRTRDQDLEAEKQKFQRGRSRARSSATQQLANAPSRVEESPHVQFGGAQNVVSEVPHGGILARRRSVSRSRGENAGVDRPRGRSRTRGGDGERFESSHRMRSLTRKAEGFQPPALKREDATVGQSTRRAPSTHRRDTNSSNHGATGHASSSATKQPRREASMTRLTTHHQLGRNDKSYASLSTQTSSKFGSPLERVDARSEGVRPGDVDNGFVTRVGAMDIEGGKQKARHGSVLSGLNWKRQLRG